MKNMKVESGLRINLPDYAYIEIWEQSGEYMVQICDSADTVQLCTENNSEGRTFNYLKKVLEIYKKANK